MLASFNLTCSTKMFTHFSPQAGKRNITLSILRGRNLLIIFFTSVAFFTSAQNFAVLDSLSQVYQQTNLHDTTRSLVCARLSFEIYFNNEFDRAKDLATEGLALAKANNFLKGASENMIVLSHFI